MTNTIELLMKGISTDGNPHSRPDGSMTQAKNVTFRRDGMVEHRPGVELWAESTPGFGAACVALHATAAGAMIGVAVDDPQVLDIVFQASIGSVSGVTTRKFSNSAQVSIAEMRGQQYLNCDDGLRRADFNASPAIPAAGYVGTCAGHGYADVSGVSAGVGVQKNYFVRYIYVMEREIADGFTVVGQPSTPYVYQATVFNLNIITNVIDLPNSAVAGDVLRVYRSDESVSDPPSGQVFLAKTHELTSADITAELFQFDDNLDKADLGRALYTNPERQGAARANHRAPECRDLEVYQGSLFCGNVTGPNRSVLSFNEAGDISGDATGIGRRDADGTITGLGSNLITGATVDGLQEGMIMNQRAGGWTGTGPMLITNISGTTITTSHAFAGASTAMPNNEFWYDSIRVRTTAGPAEDQYYPVAEVFNAVGGGLSGLAYFLKTFLIGLESSAEQIIPSDELIAYGVTDAHAIDILGVAGVQKFTRFVIEEPLRAGITFEVFATHGDEYDPALPTPDAGIGNGEDSISDVWTDAVFFSKNREPEHFPLGNFIRVGILNQPLLRMISTRDAMWVFKADGIYRISGYGERSGFRVDPVDLNTVLVAPRCATLLGDTIYAWTNRGIVMIQGGAITPISMHHLESDLLTAQRALGAANTNTPGVWMAANPLAHEVYLGVTETDGANSADKVYVLNTKTLTWATWEGTVMGEMACALWHPLDAAMYYGVDRLAESSSMQIHRERTANDIKDPFDASAVVTGGGLTGTTVFWDSVIPTTYSPAIGDMAYNPVADEYAIVTAVANPKEVTVDQNVDSWSGDTTFFVAYESCIEWAAKSARHPLFMKYFRQFSLSWERLSDNLLWNAVFDSTSGNTASTVINAEVKDPSNPKALQRRVFIPVEHARVASLKPQMTITSGRWRVSGMGLIYEPISERI